LREALLGFRRELQHLDEHSVTIDREGLITKPGFVQIIKGEGMPMVDHNSDLGDLMVAYVIEFPKELTSQQKTDFKEFFN